jgi:GxxExxY protein
MNTDEHGYKHAELTGKIIKVFYEVYNELGYGFLESVYENALVIALRASGLQAEPQKPIQVWFRGQPVGNFEADILVASLILLELKATRTLDSSHEAQLLNYLRATEIGWWVSIVANPDFPWDFEGRPAQKPREFGTWQHC